MLKEYARITTELNTIRSANAYYMTFEQIEQTAQDYADTCDRVISTQLSAIEDIINPDMKEITTRIVGNADIIPPKLKLEKISEYDFDTKGDGGSGTAYRGLITFDLTNIYASIIPFIIHDADLMDSMAKPILEDSKVIELAAGGNELVGLGIKSTRKINSG